MSCMKSAFSRSNLHCVDRHQSASLPNCANRRIPRGSAIQNATPPAGGIQLFKEILAVAALSISAATTVGGITATAAYADCFTVEHYGACEYPEPSRPVNSPEIDSPVDACLGPAGCITKG